MIRSLTSILFILSYLFLNMAEARQAQIHNWERLGVSLEDLYERVAFACPLGDKQFASCLEAYRQIIKFSSPHLEISSRLSEPSKVLAHIGPFVIFKSPEQSWNLSVTELLNKSSKARVSRLNNWRKLFTHLSRQEVEQSIEGLHRWVKRHLSEKHFAAYSLNIGYTAFSQTLLDPYTQLKVSRSSPIGLPVDAQVGIGVQLFYRAGGTFIARLLPGGAAEQSGIQVFDRIHAVNGEVVNGQPPVVWDHLLSGPSESTLQLKIIRDRKFYDITIKRQRLQIEPIEVDRITHSQGPIGYIHLMSFSGNHLCESFASQLESLTAQAPRGLILDLRSNPGGSAKTVECLLDLFLPPDQDVARFKNFRVNYEESLHLRTRHPQKFQLPLVVLVNDQSKSGSELFSGVIQHYGRGLIVGRPTHGKGTGQVQVSFAEFNNIPVLQRQTVSEYFLPADKPVNGYGITPDVLLPRSRQEVRVRDYLFQPLRYEGKPFFDFNRAPNREKTLEPNLRDCLRRHDPEPETYLLSAIKALDCLQSFH